MKLMNKKGLAELSSAGLGIGVLVIILAVVALILVELKTAVTPSGISNENVSNTAMNITDKGLDALFTFAKFLGIIAIAIVAGYIIFVVVRAFRSSQGGSAV